MYNSMLLINVCHVLFFMYKIINTSILLINVYKDFLKFLVNSSIFKGEIMRKKVFFIYLNSSDLYLKSECINTSFK